MKFATTISMALLLGSSIHAEEDRRITLDGPKDDRNRFWAGGTVLLNAKVDYKTANRSLSAAQAGPPTGGSDHFYDDGYNRVDSSGNAFPPGSTSFWGYQNASQLFDSPTDPTVGIDSIAMNIAAQSSGGQHFEDTADPQPGFEMGYARIFGMSDRWSWGAEGIFGYTYFNTDDGRSGQAGVTSLTDVYSLNVGGILVTAPTPPYAGPFSAAPGSPLIGDSPTRTTSTSSATLKADREFDANIFITRLGPFVDYAVSRRFSLGAGAGLVLLFVDSRFRYDDTLSYPGASGPETTRQRGSVDEFDVLVGGYLGVDARFDLTDDLALYGNVQYLGTTDTDTSEAGQKATLDFSESFWLSAGLSLSF